MTLTNIIRRLAPGAAMASALAMSAALTPAHAADKGPIKIGVVSEESAIVGQAISQGANLAAEDINKAGGINGRKIKIITYDDHSSASDAVRAYQRAVQQDHVVAVVTTFISEVALAVEPWAARLHIPTITPGAASNLISKQVHDNYARYKYMFEGWFPSPILARAVCDASHDLFVKDLHMKTAAIMSEDADWTKPLDAGYVKCLPKVGLKVVDEVSFNPDTTDFTPIFNGIEVEAPGRHHHRHRPCRRAADGAVALPAGADSVRRHQRAGDQPDLLEEHQWRDGRRDHPGRHRARPGADPDDREGRRGIREEVWPLPGVHRLHRL